jgi:hypothetical protein
LAIGYLRSPDQVQNRYTARSIEVEKAVAVGSDRSLSRGRSPGLVTCPGRGHIARIGQQLRGLSFAQPQPRRVDRRQQHAIPRDLDRAQKPRRLLRREHHWQPLLASRVRDALNLVPTIQNLDIQEAQRTDDLVEQTRRHVFGLSKPDLILGDLCCAELIGRLAEVPCKPCHGLDVRLLGSWGVVPGAEDTAHPFAQWGSDHDVSPFALKLLAPTRSVRLWSLASLRHSFTPAQHAAARRLSPTIWSSAASEASPLQRRVERSRCAA